MLRARLNVSFLQKSCQVCYAQQTQDRLKPSQTRESSLDWLCMARLTSDEAFFVVEKLNVYFLLMIAINQTSAFCLMSVVLHNFVLRRSLEK